MRKIFKKILLSICKEINFLTQRKNSIKKNLIKNILVIQPGGIGDILRLFPALEVISLNFPQASISVLVFPKVREVFELFPRKKVIKEVIEYEPEGKHKSILKRFSLILSLRKKDYDLIYAPVRGRGTDGTMLMAFFIGAPYRIGFATRDTKGVLYTISTKFKGNLSITKQNLLLLKAAGLEIKKETTELNISKGEMLLVKNLINNYFPVITLHFGANWQAKYRTWPIENYISLIKHLLERRGAKVILIGGKAEIKIAERVCQKVKHNHLINLVGKTTIPQMTAIIKSSHLFIGNDSGPLHIAQLVGTPFVGIFGATSPIQVLSHSTNTPKVILKPNLPCSPCYTHQEVFKPACKGKVECFKKITVEEVIKATVYLLDRIREEKS